MESEVQELYRAMKATLGQLMPDNEIYSKAEIAVEINHLKSERKAVILGHNYMEPALFYSIPDFTGDSLDLSRKAAETEQEVIVFCGVKFMAETAKILNPTKTVLLPAENAGCSLAASITAADVRAMRDQFPGVPVVSYVNTYAEVKAESDICCTSSNAAAVVESLKSDTVIFLPDQYLASNVARQTGKKIIFPSLSGFTGQGTTPQNVQMIGWHGKCEVHEKFTMEDIEAARKQFPDVVVLAHPECSPEVVAACDYAGSTNGMIRYVQQSQAAHFLVLTEAAMVDNIAAANPDKGILRLCMERCPHMDMITLENVRAALLHNQYIVEVPEPVRSRAYQAVQRMIEIG